MREKVAYTMLGMSLVIFGSIAWTKLTTVRPGSQEPTLLQPSTVPTPSVPTVAPQIKIASSVEAVMAVTKAFDEGGIRPTIAAREMGFGFHLINGRPMASATNGLSPYERGRCPQDSYAVSVFLYRAAGHFYSIEQEQTVWLCYCVNQFTGNIRAENDAARQLTVREEDEP